MSLLWNCRTLRIHRLEKRRLLHGGIEHDDDDAIDLADASPADPFVATPVAESTPLALHIHAHVAVFVQGEPLEIPANIGVSEAGALPIHTHDTSGVIHIESPVVRTFTLSNVFEVVGPSLAQRARAMGYEALDGMSVTLNGRHVSNPLTVELADGDDFTIHISSAHSAMPFLDGSSNNAIPVFVSVTPTIGRPYSPNPLPMPGTYPLSAVGKVETSSAMCTGTLLRPGGIFIQPAEWVLTAAHCFDGFALSGIVDFYIGGSSRKVSSRPGGIFIHPGYRSVSDSDSNDLALIHLASGVTDVPGLELYRGAPREGMSFAMVGFGGTYNDPDQSGPGPGSGVKRWGVNRIEDVDNSFIYSSDRDDGSFLIPGDSGGPDLITYSIFTFSGPQRQSEIMGVHSNTATSCFLFFCDADDHMVRVDTHAGWIDSIAGTRPRPKVRYLLPNGQPYTGLLFEQRELSGDEGSLSTYEVARVSKSVIDAQDTGPFSATINWGDNSAPSTGLVTPIGLGEYSITGTHAYLDNGQYSIIVTLTGALGTISGNSSALIRNVAPTVSISGVPTASPEGQSITLTSVVSDRSPIDAAAGFVLSWAVTKDGAPYSLASTPNFSFMPDDNGTYVVTLTATDKDNGTGAGSQSIIVFNVAPAVSVTGPASGVRGQPRTFTFQTTDPSPVDQLAGFSYSIDWDGDGVIDQTTSGLSGIQVTHIYLVNGLYPIHVTATDKDLGVSKVATWTIGIKTVDLQPDPSDPLKTALAVGGTLAADVIVVMPSAAGVSVLIGGGVLGSFAPTGSIIVYGQAGDDDIQIAGGLRLAAFLHGDEGNDRLHGGGGPNVLVGGSDADILIGGSQRTILIGGVGADRMIGQDESVMIAGRTSYDLNDVALGRLLAEWSSSRDYAARVQNLIGTSTGPKANQPFYLVPNSSVFDDQEADILNPSSGLDLLFLDDAQDRLKGNTKASKRIPI